MKQEIGATDGVLGGRAADCCDCYEMVYYVSFLLKFMESELGALPLSGFVGVYVLYRSYLTQRD